MCINELLIEQTYLMIRLCIYQLPEGLLYGDDVVKVIFYGVNHPIVCYASFYDIITCPRLFPISTSDNKIQPILIVSIETK